jgi:hypothetical protein
LSDVQELQLIELLAHCSPVQPPVTLRAGRPHRRALGSVQHSKLDAGLIGCAAHDAAQCVHLAYNCALRNPADSGIAGHLADGLEILGEEEGAGAAARGESCSLGSGVAAADHDHIVSIHRPH